MYSKEVKTSPQKLDVNEGSETNKKLTIVRGILKGTTAIFKVVHIIIMLCTSQMPQICTCIYIYHICIKDIHICIFHNTLEGKYLQT